MRKSIGTLIKRLLLFLGYALVLYFLLMLVTVAVAPDSFKRNINFRMGSYGHMHSRLKELRETQNVEILLLGSSHTYRGFDTRIFEDKGWSCFNLGSSSQSHLQTQVLLRRYLKQLNPKWVIYEVYPGTFETDGVESSTDLLSNDQVNIHSLPLLIKTPGLKVLNTFVVGLWYDWLGKKASFVEGRKKGPDTYIPGGYVEMELAHNQPQEDSTSRKWALRDRQLRAFRQNMSLLKANGADVLLVQTPITQGLFNSYTNNVEFDSIMLAHGRYYNFNDLMQVNDSLHFYDRHHLNQLGVEAFNNQLIDLLLK
ncbi:MAG: hypothetical protein LC643_09810 [Bacteroidales bacterium]|nr:hypothetical protein [Bacteroidales bacterium]